MRAGAASSALYLQFRWDPLQRKRLDEEAPSAAQPHPNRTTPRGSPAPQAHRSATVPPVDGGAAKRCVCQCTPTSHPYQGPEKGSVVPFLPEHLPRERQRVFLPAAAHAHKLAHGPGEGGKQGGRTNSNQLKTEPGTRRLWGAQISLSLCGSAVRESDSDLAIQERNP